MVSEKEEVHIKQSNKQAEHYYEEGYRIVVDCDLESYFDDPSSKIKSLFRRIHNRQNGSKTNLEVLGSGILDKDIYIETSEGGTPRRAFISRSSKYLLK
ncbi:hypothetical protein [Rummeliibacillus sp. SL167]|uniref:hypothetical protein n=1 Tax=Rummeliibacillus sp. SL167 TaxID=2579792 RepID=UPI0011B3C93F|nr:hypothetical protein [Rummeliibacillus sp. SL167]